MQQCVPQSPPAQGAKKAMDIAQRQGRHPRRNLRPVQNVQQLALGSITFPRSVLKVNATHDACWKRDILEGSADENVRSHNDPHPGPGSTSACACLMSDQRRCPSDLPPSPWHAKSGVLRQSRHPARWRPPRADREPKSAAPIRSPPDRPCFGKIPAWFRCSFRFAQR